MSSQKSFPVDSDKAREACAKVCERCALTNSDASNMARILATAIRQLTLEECRVSPSPQEGHGEPCYYCGEKCNGLAGNPSEWPVALCHADDPGRVKWHHTGCVDERLRKVESLSAQVAELREELHDMSMHFIYD